MSKSKVMMMAMVVAAATAGSAQADMVLYVNADTDGSAYVMNTRTDGMTEDLTFYSITSDSGALNPDAHISLAEMAAGLPPFGNEIIFFDPTLFCPCVVLPPLPDPTAYAISDRLDCPWQVLLPPNHKFYIGEPGFFSGDRDLVFSRGDVAYVPEPATMGLLALGALAIRRRK